MARSHIICAALIFAMLPPVVLAGSVRPSFLPDTTPEESVQPVFFMSASVTKLQNDAFALEKTVNTYLTIAEELDSDLKLVISGLSMVDKVAGDLSDFDKALGEVRDLLEVAKQIPPIESEATALYDAINATKPVVDDVSGAVNEVNDDLTPVREALEKFEADLSKAIGDIKDYEKKLDDYVQHVVNAQTCINDLPSGSVRTNAQNDLDALASMSDQFVTSANTVLTDILSDFNTLEDIINNELQPIFGTIETFETDLGVVLHAVDILLTPLRDLSALWHKKFRVKFPYPNPTWKNPLRISHYTLKIGFSVIIKGVHEIEQEIKRLLKKALYAAAKVFGLKKLAQELVRDAERELNKIRNSMELKIDIKVPGLDKLEGELKKIQDAIRRMEQSLKNDVQPFIDAMEQLKRDEQAFKKMYDDCKKAL